MTVAQRPEKAFIVLLTNDGYLPGLLVLHRSLVQCRSVYPLVVQALPSLSTRARQIIQDAGIPIIDTVAVLPAEDKIKEMFRPRFVDAFSKLAQLQLTQFKRLVGLDADLLVLQNIDHLMEMELPPNSIACVPDCTCNPYRHKEFDPEWVPANCAYSQPQPLKLHAGSHQNHRVFNSGVAVFEPSTDAWAAMKNMLDCNEVSLFWGDQELLRHFYKDHFVPLPWEYNALKTLPITHAPLFDLEHIRVIHYTMDKPWDTPKPKDERVPKCLNELWLAEFDAFKREWEAKGLSGLEYIETLVPAAQVV